MASREIFGCAGKNSFIKSAPIPAVNEKAVLGIQTCSAPGRAAGAAAALDVGAAAAAAVVVAALLAAEEVRVVEAATVVVEATLLDAAVVAAAVAAGVLAVDAALDAAGADAAEVTVPTAEPPQALSSATAPAGRMTAVNAWRREMRERGLVPKTMIRFPLYALMPAPGRFGRANQAPVARKQQECRSQRPICQRSGRTGATASPDVVRSARRTAVVRVNEGDP
jgi:hypothetical protein